MIDTEQVTVTELEPVPGKAHTEEGRTFYVIRRPGEPWDTTLYETEAGARYTEPPGTRVVKVVLPE